MLEAIRRAISFLRQKQVLHKLGVVISVTVIGSRATCCITCSWHDSNEVIEPSRDRAEPDRAGGAVRGADFTLTFYDLFAFARSAARHAYRVNALAAFTSYSIGHNVGASVFTGGAVRYRLFRPA